MENYNNDGFDSQFSDRRDYGSERNSDRNYTGGYSQAGRKLRHRKSRTNGSDSDSGYQPGNYHSSRKSYSSEEHGGPRPFSDRRGSGYGERRSGSGSRYSDNGRGYGDRNSFGERSERGGFGTRRPAQRKSYGDGESRRFSGDGEGRRFYGESDGRRDFSSGRTSIYQMLLSDLTSLYE